MKVRSDIMKLSKTMHTWVGITSGILLFICFFAGGLSMFQHDLSRWGTPQQQVLTKIESSQYNQLIQQVQSQHPATQKAFTLNISSKEFHHAPITWTERQSRDEGFNTTQMAYLASLDEQGHVQVTQENVSKLGWLIEQLHETAGIPGMAGHHTLGVYVMGVVAALYFLALMSGLIVLLPTLIKDYFTIRPGKNKKRFWLDTHNVIGISSLPFHIMISITVVVFAFHDYFYDSIRHLAMKGEPPFTRPAAQIIEIQQDHIDVQKILAKVQQVAPEYEVQYIQFNGLDDPQKANARIALYSGEQLLRGANYDFMSMNPYNVDIYNHQGIHTQTPNANTFVHTLFSLHFGSYGGYSVRWIYLILGLGGAFLFYSGNLLWVETRARKQKRLQDPLPTQRKDVVFMANLTIGSCLGCILALSSSMVLGRFAHLALDVTSMNHLYMYSYYAFFVAAVLYSFAIGYKHALGHLLCAIGISLLLIPMSSLGAYIFPKSGLWYDPHSLAVDAVAFILSLVFFKFYQNAIKRGRNAEVGSLWSFKKA